MRSSHLRRGCFGIYSECGGVGAFNECLVWKSRLYSAWGPPNKETEGGQESLSWWALGGGINKQL